MKKSIGIGIALVAHVFVLILPLCSVTVFAEDALIAGGSGTEADPYQISTVYRLENIRLKPDAHYVRINDIVFTDTDFSENGDFYNYQGTFFAGNGKRAIR